MAAGTDPTMEQRIADIHRMLEVGLERIGGQLGVVVQRLEHHDAHRAETAARLDRHDDRLDALERTAATREDLAEGARRTIQVVSAILAAAAILTTVITSIITAR